MPLTMQTHVGGGWWAVGAQAHWEAGGDLAGRRSWQRAHSAAGGSTWAATARLRWEAGDERARRRSWRWVHVTCWRADAMGGWRTCVAGTQAQGAASVRGTWGLGTCRRHEAVTLAGGCGGGCWPRAGLGDAARRVALAVGQAAAATARGAVFPIASDLHRSPAAVPGCHTLRLPV